MLLASTNASSWPPLTNVVGREDPSQRTSDAVEKALPNTEIVSDGSPVTAWAGDTDVATGTALPIENVNAFEVPAAAATVTLAEPGEGMSELSTLPVSTPELTNVVGIAAPFQSTWEAGVKLVPFTVMVERSRVRRGAYRARSRRASGRRPPR